MNKSIVFERTKDDVLFVQLTKTYFTNLGFWLTREHSSLLVFERGSTLLNFFTFNPLKWKSRIEISIEENEVNAAFEISTIGQLVTKKENHLWVELIQNYHLTIAECKDHSGRTMEGLKSTKANSFKFVKAALIGALVAGIPAIILAIITGFHSIASIGAASGATVAFMNKLNEEKAT